MGFVGSGDLKSGAFAYWSVARAYTAAYAAPGTNPCMDLVDQAGLNPITISILSTGWVDIAAIKSWVAAHSVTTIKIKKLYDHTANAFHVSQATLANMPILLLTHPGLGNNPNLPTMHFIQSANMTLSSGATGLSSAVGTFSVVGRIDAWFGGGIIQATPYGLFGFYNNMHMYAGSNPSLGILNDNFHCYQAVFNGASSMLFDNGVVTASGFNTGTGPLGSPFVFGQWNNGFPMGGEISEIRFDSSAWTTSDCAAESANQKAFWFSGPAYEGFVASRCRSRLTEDHTNVYINSRSAHFATEDLTAIKVSLSSRNGSAFTASVEYPAGTFTQLTFAAGSASTGTIGAQTVFSDYATVSIPKGATFWIRIFENATSGGISRYNIWQNAFLGEAAEISASVLTDKTMSGTITNSGTPLGVSCPPDAIVGVTVNRSVLVIGDSIGQGERDADDTSNTATGFNDVYGFINRSIASLGIPFVNSCISGSVATGDIASLYWACCSHLISEFAINDLNGGETSATLIGSISAWSTWVGPSTKFYQTTCTPHSLSSDGWATLANQSSFGATFDTQRVAFNTALRAGTTGIPRLTGYLDVASVLESGLNSNKWIATPSPPYTADGIHPQVNGHMLLLAAGVVQAIFAIQSPKNKRNLVLRKRA